MCIRDRRELEEKKIAQKFVGSYGKDDEIVEEEIKKEEKEEEEVKTKAMPVPPSKKKGGLRERLGIKKPEPEPQSQNTDFDFLGGSSKTEATFTASATPNDDLYDLTAPMDNMNLIPDSMDLSNPSDTTDLIDFGAPTTSNTGQNNNDIDLLVGLNGGNNNISSGGNSSTGGRKIGGDMFMDVNNDLFDLSGLKLSQPKSTVNQEASRANLQSTGMGSGHGMTYMGSGNTPQINGLGTGKQQKKDLNINEFDFI